MSREVRWLARELRPLPRRHRWPWPVRLLGWVVRHVPEIAVVVLVVLLVRACVHRVGPVWTGTGAGLLALGTVAWDRSRRWVLAGLGCLVTRYRLRTALRELRLSARSGRLPGVLWMCPTPVGERVWLLCPVGVSAEDIADETDRIRSACYARDVRVVRDPRWSALVSVEVIRRDPLASSAAIRTPLVDVLDAVPLPRQEVAGRG
ncbi:MAG TPA: hypothetical protein VIS06_01610 [Mycobacteriales bacterium]